MDNLKIKADLVIGNCRQLITCKKTEDSPVGEIAGGWIAIKGEHIAAVGRKEELEEKVIYSKDSFIDGSGKVVLPGFVDSHTHLIFGGSRVEEYALKMFTDDEAEFRKRGIKRGIMATVDSTRGLSSEELFEIGKRRIYQMMSSGTTTVESKSGYGLTAESEIRILLANKELDAKLPIDVVSTFLGAHGWPEDIKKEKYMKVLTDEMMPFIGEHALAKYCDIWCDQGHYTAEESRIILEAGRKYGMEPKIHSDAYSYIGGSDLAADMKMVSADHLNYTPENVLKKLSSAGVTGVLLPAIDFAVKHPKQFDPRPMLNAGMNIALATNCCPGCYNTSMQFIMMLASRQHGLRAEESLIAATLGGAMALGLQKDRGSLETGKLADIQIWDTESYKDGIYKLGINLVEKVIKRGKIVIDMKG